MSQQWEGVGTWNLSSWKTKTHLFYKYHGCWWPGNTKSLDISGHCFALVHPEYSSFSNSKVNNIFSELASCTYAFFLNSLQIDCIHRILFWTMFTQVLVLHPRQGLPTPYTWLPRATKVACGQQDFLFKGAWRATWRLIKILITFLLVFG